MVNFKSLKSDHKLLRVKSYTLYHRLYRVSVLVVSKGKIVVLVFSDEAVGQALPELPELKISFPSSRCHSVVTFMLPLERLHS